MREEEAEMTMQLRPEIEEGLKALAASRGLSVEEYLQKLVERELPHPSEDHIPTEGSGMIQEKGLFVYRTGKPLPSHVVDNAIRHTREDRSERILGDLP